MQKKDLVCSPQQWPVIDAKGSFREIGAKRWKVKISWKQPTKPNDDDKRDYRSTKSVHGSN